MSIWDYALLAVTAVMVVRQAILFTIMALVIVRGDAWYPGFRWWIHLWSTVALVFFSTLVLMGKISL